VAIVLSVLLGQTIQLPQKDTRWPGNQKDRQHNGHRKIPDGRVTRRTDNTMATERYLYWLPLGLRLLITPFLLVIILTVLGVRLLITPFLLGHCIDCQYNDPREKVQSEAVISRTVNTMTQEKRCNQKP
jgi:membrane protein insertase Oxa1/YidC/SpoIIIJ